jgi:hypothetical protein
MTRSVGVFATEGRRFVCEECRLPFAPHTGGLCRVCGNTYCDAHFFGRFSLLQRWLGRDRPCVACREHQPAKEDQP